MKALTLLAFVLVLAGCATAGLEPATTLADRITYAEGQNQSLIDAADSSLNAGTLSSTAAGSIRGQADDIQLILVGAKTALAGGDVSTAQGKLILALTTIQQLQDYLRAQGAKK